MLFYHLQELLCTLMRGVWTSRGIFNSPQIVFLTRLVDPRKQRASFPHLIPLRRLFETEIAPLYHPLSLLPQKIVTARRCRNSWEEKYVTGCFITEKPTTFPTSNIIFSFFYHGVISVQCFLMISRIKFPLNLDV